MSFMTTDHSNAGGFEPIKPGKYEAIISEVEVTTSSNGNPMLKVVNTIRSDVDQAFGKRKVFDNLVQTEKAMFKFDQVAKAVGIPSGTNIGSIEEFASLIIFKPVNITIKNEPYQDRIQDRVTFYDLATVSYEGGPAAGAADPFAEGGTPIDISEDDLPF